MGVQLTKRIALTCPAWTCEGNHLLEAYGPIVAVVVLGLCAIYACLWLYEFSHMRQAMVEAWAAPAHNEDSSESSGDDEGALDTQLKQTQPSRLAWLTCCRAKPRGP